MEDAVMQITNIESAIEAILYAAGYPVKYTKLSEVLGLEIKDVKTMVEHMAVQYNKEDSSRGINLLVFEETCQFCTKEQYAPYIREALGIKRGGNLSASSLEVLAVIAYNQPVTRAYVDTVRGVDSSYAMNSLIDKGLIEACGRLDAPGRPMIYKTTEKFLRVFGINSLEDLPQTESLDELAVNEAESIITINDVLPAEASSSEESSESQEVFNNPSV
jgi:segregation and condensation protein B